MPKICFTGKALILSYLCDCIKLFALEKEFFFSHVPVASLVL